MDPFYLVGLIKVDLQYGGKSYFARNTNVTFGHSNLFMTDKVSFIAVGT